MLNVINTILSFALITYVSGWKFSSPKSTLTKHLSIIATGATLLSITTNPIDVNAVSGGGKDFANKVLSEGESFEGRKEESKDFSQCDGQKVNFKNSVLRGSRFFRANLKEADFSGADLTAVSLEDTSLDGAIFKDAILESSYLSLSIKDAANLENVDFTEASLPDFARKKLCERTDVRGKNPKTGVDTYESLFCQ